MNQTHTSASKRTTSVIDWNLPDIRSGYRGLLDRTFGPGYTRAEFYLQTLIPVISAVAVPTLASAIHVPWTLAQQLVAAILALDGVGGVITNSTSSAKRWFHREAIKPRQHLAFTTSHLLHFALVAWLFADQSLIWFLGASAYLLIAAPLVIHAPLHIQRPLSAALVTLGILFSVLALPEIAGMQWVLPVFYMKLLGAHLTREEPYRQACDSKRNITS